MKVGLYAGVSTDRQRESQTIQSQLEALSNFAANEGLTVEDCHVYVDDGHSGYHFERPGLDRLRDAARDGLLDIVIVHNPDRLARRYAYQVLLLEELERFGVELRFVEQPPPDSPDQMLLVQIQGAISEYERARIVERTRRGRLYWARQGRPVCARVPFGYRYVQGDRDNAPAVVIDEERAEAVRQMFAWYTKEELSFRRIALRLRERGITPPQRHGDAWDATTIGMILRNETYLGTWYLNRYRMERSSTASRPRRVERDREEWIPISVPPILEPRVFCRAQQIREARASDSQLGAKPLRHPTTHLLRRLVVCGDCGRKMTSLNSGPGKGYRYYWCRGPDVHRTGKTVARCPRPTVLAPELDSFVWSDVVKLLTDPELQRQAFREQAGGEANVTLGATPLEQQRKQLGRRLADIERQRHRLLTAYEQGAIELDELTQRRNRLAQESSDAQRQLENFDLEERAASAFADLDGRLGAISNALEEGLDQMDVPRRMQLCQQLIERVVVEGNSAEIHYRFPVSTDCNPGGERHERVPTTARAVNAGEAVAEDAAPEVGAKLALDETRKAREGPITVGTG